MHACIQVHCMCNMCVYVTKEKEIFTGIENILCPSMMHGSTYYPKNKTLIIWPLFSRISHTRKWPSKYSFSSTIDRVFLVDRCSPIDSPSFRHPQARTTHRWSNPFVLSAICAKSRPRSWANGSVACKRWPVNSLHVRGNVWLK